MADETGVKVSQLPLGENLADDDLMYAVENGVSKKVEVSYLQNRIVGDVDSTPTASSDNLVTSGGVYNMVHTLDFNVFHDLAQISNSIADAFSASESYSEGDYVVYDYSLYKFTADKSAGAWDSSKATPVAVVEELGSGGTTVVPNPSGEATDTLEKIKIDQTIYDFATSNVYGEASGAIASFSDGSNNPLVKLEADINPIQDLHGYDKPWAGGAGKNKFQTTLTTTTVSGVTFTVNNDGTITTSGTPSANISTVIFGEITLPAGSYKANGNAVGSASSLRMIVYNVTDSSLIGSVYDGNEVSFTLSESKQVRLYPIILQEYGSVNGIVLKPMIRLATETDASFAPYENICPISGWSSVEVTGAGKNIANMTYGDKVPSISTGKMVSSYGWSSDFCKLDKNTKYVLSSNLSSRYVLFYDKDKTYLGYTVNYSTTGYILNNSAYWNNTAYIKLRVDAASTATMDVQLEVGSTATSYEAYNADTETISLGQTVYGGKLNVTTGELTVDRALVEYDGSSDETWAYASAYGGFRVTISDANINGIPSSQVISNRFVGSNSRGTADKDIEGKMLTYASASDNTYLFFTTQITDLSEWKTWLSENITQVEYPLATPTTIELTPTEVDSLLGANNIWADCGDSDVVYIRDLNLFLNQLDVRVKALENA